MSEAEEKAAQAEMIRRFNLRMNARQQLEDACQAVEAARILRLDARKPDWRES